MSKSIRSLKPDYSGTMDHANEVHHICPVCDSNIWSLKVTFDEYEIAQYFLEMECASCGTYALAPTPLDKLS